MPSVLGAGVLSAVLAIALGPRFIALLRRLRFGQNIREEGPEGHRVKQGTPTMGGLLIVCAAAVAYLVASDHGVRSLTALGAIILCAGIGFLDDWLKVSKKRSLGLRGRYKLLGQAVVALAIAVVAQQQDLSTQVFVPGLEWRIDLGVGWYALVFLMVLGATNAVNLTDGLDGLASTTSAIATLAYTAIAVISYQIVVVPERAGLSADQLKAFQPSAEALERLDLAVLAAALLGAITGFLWFNAFPADVFMGDTGSLALGGALAAFAVFTKTELLLALIGGVFAIETLSVIVQVVWFKRTGRRVFLMAPIHHHFEMKAWSETKIMVRFAIAAAVFAASAFVVYYLRADRFNPEDRARSQAISPTVASASDEPAVYHLHLP